MQNYKTRRLYHRCRKVKYRYCDLIIKFTIPTEKENMQNRKTFFALLLYLKQNSDKIYK